MIPCGTCKTFTTLSSNPETKQTGIFYQPSHAAQLTSILMEIKQLQKKIRRRPPSRLWSNVDNLPQAVIYDLAHDGKRTPVAEFKSHVCNH